MAGSPPRRASFQVPWDADGHDGESSVARVAVGTRQDSPRAGAPVCPSPTVAAGCAPWALKRRPRLRSGEHVPATRAAQRPHIWGAQRAGDQALPLQSRSRPGGPPVPPVPDPRLLLPGSAAAAVKCADQSARGRGKGHGSLLAQVWQRGAGTEDVADTGWLGLCGEAPRAPGGGCCLPTPRAGPSAALATGTGPEKHPARARGRASRDSGRGPRPGRGAPQVAMATRSRLSRHKAAALPASPLAILLRTMSIRT